MATNFVQPGLVLTFTAPSGGVTSGVGVLIGTLFCVPLVTAAATVRFAAGVAGVYDIAADAADTFNEGEAVYWDAGNSRVTVVSTGNTFVGWATEDAATPAVVNVLLATTGAI
jgi:predicted RecA/RadA family phage recombinase